MNRFNVESVALAAKAKAKSLGQKIRANKLGVGVFASTFGGAAMAADGSLDPTVIVASFAAAAVIATAISVGWTTAHYSVKSSKLLRKG